MFTAIGAGVFPNHYHRYSESEMSHFIDAQHIKYARGLLEKYAVVMVGKSTLLQR